MSVTKVGSGGTIIVRTGVLSGLGPVGPRGGVGEVGPQGPGGSQGPVGPAGALNEQLSVARLTSAQSLSPGNVITPVAFQTVERDDFGIFTSSTVLTPNQVAGIYRVDAFVVFSKPANDGNGQRQFYLLEDGSITDVIVGAAACDASALSSTLLTLSTVFEAKAGCTYKFFASSNDDLAVALSDGRVAVTRVGNGNVGPSGPVGGAGAVGPTGGVGPTGPSGSATSGFTSFEDLRHA